MPRVDFGAWLPDQPAIGGPYLVDAKNVLPLAQGYGPLAGLTETTSALTAQCRGLFGARDDNQASRLYAGDSTKLYQLSGTTWQDYSRVGGYGPAVNATRWRFATYGDRLLACNGIDALQKLDMSSGASAFSNLAGTPGAPEYVASYAEFVFIAGGSLGSALLKWSGIGNSENWTAGTGMSDEQEFADGGRIVGLIPMRAALYVLQEQCIRRVVFVGGDVIMQIDKLVDGIGAVEPNSVSVYGQRCFFLAGDGWYQFDGVSEPAPIGNEKFDRWFLDDASRTYWYNMSAAIDPANKILMVAYTSSAATLPDSLLIYNYALGKAAYARQTSEIIGGAASLAISPDDLTTYVPDDHPEIGPDDPFWLGGALYLAAMTQAHKLASFSAANLEATLTSSLSMLFDGRRASIAWVKPVADTTAATVAAGYAVRPGDAATYVTTVAQQASGRCPQRGANGFYHAAKVTVPAGTTWTYARGVEFMPSAAMGVR